MKQSNPPITEKAPGLREILFTILHMPEAKLKAMIADERVPHGIKVIAKEILDGHVVQNLIDFLRATEA